MNKQVDKKHYHFSRYVRPDRWVSYYHQLEEISNQESERVLEIGIGDGLVGKIARTNLGVQYQSLDIDSELGPDLVGSVLDLPLADNSFDLVCVFEVLEHLPFEQFEVALQQIARVSKRDVIISLPHFGPPIKFSFKLPFLPEIRLAWKLPWPRKHEFNGEHYWEIGKRGYSIRRISRSLEKFFIIEREFIPFENQYHHFFILRKLNFSA